MLDIARVAFAFSSYPGHPRWNLKADLNNDNVVNAIDISLVAKDFGKRWVSYDFDEPLNWTVVSGTWSLMNGMLEGSSNVDGLIYANDNVWKDFTLTAKVKISADSPNAEVAFCVCFVDSRNFYLAGLGCRGHRVSISRTADNVEDELIFSGDRADVAKDVWYIVSIKVSGGAIRLYVDDVLELAVNDSTLTSGEVGIRLWDSHVYADYVTVSGFASASNDSTSNDLWRPFSNDSIWNTKIPENAALHPNSEQMIEWLKNTPHANGVHFGINIYEWSVPIYDAYANTPRVTVYEYDGTVYHTNVPMPTDAQVDPMQDKHMVVIDWDNKIEWDFSDLTYNVRQPNKWVAGACIPWDLYGSGVHPNSVWGARGSSIPNLGGLIRPEEIKAGVIPHALSFGCCYPKQGWKVYPPAATTDGHSTDQYAIPEGARLQLDPSINVDTIPGLSRAGKIIAKCMQEYGIILVDSADGLPLYAENPMGRATDPWPALSFDGYSASPIPSNFRVINYAVFGAVEEPF
jgi:hypothetical protein